MARAYPYDILLDGQGYMLARQGQLGHGRRAWQVELQGASIAEQAAGPRWGNQAAPVDLPVVFSTAHLGYGDDRYQVEGRYHYGVGADARFPGMVLPGPALTVVSTGLADDVTAFAEVGGALLFLAGRYVKRFTAAGAIADECDLGSAAVDMEAFRGNLYVGLGFGAGAYIHRRDAAGVWTADNDVQRGHMAVLGERLWATSGPAEVRGVANDPMTAADWTGAYPVGDPGTVITGLVGLEDLLYVGKSDGLYVLDSSGIAWQRTPELRGVVDASNCAGMGAWHGALWVPHLRGLLRVQEQGEAGSLVSSVQPGRDAAADNPVRGRVTALVGDDRWLYVALYTGADTYILAGREMGTTDGVAMLWHPLAMLEGRACRAMHLSGLWANPRLFLGVGPDVGYIILPRQADSPLADADCRYARQGRIFYPAHDSRVPATTKLYKSVEIHAEGLDAANYIDVFLRLDDGDWRYAGRAQQSPVSRLLLDPRGLAGKAVRVRLNYSLASDAHVIRILDVVVRAAERPELVPVIAAAVRCADRLPTNGQMVCPRSGAEMAAALRALAKAERAVTLVDPAGGVRQVVVLGPLGESEVYQEGQIAQELVLTVRMAVFAEEERAPEMARYTVVLGGAADGFAVPTTVPTGIGATSASAAAVVRHEGTAPSRPAIWVRGPITDLLIRNEATGEVLDFQGSSIPAGETWLIDMRLEPAIVVDGDGEDRSAELAAGSDLLTWHLVPGDNAIGVAGSAIDADTAIWMEWPVRML